MTSLKMFAKWAGWGDPLADYQPPRVPPGEPHPLPEGMDGVRRMIEAADRPSHKALVALCGMAGLRVAEALSLRPSHVDMVSMKIRVLGKGEKVRFIPLTDELWKILVVPLLDALPKDSTIVGLHDRAARKVITRLAVKAGLQRHVKSHDLRSTFASELYNKTLDMRVVQMLLGHSSVETTQIYTGIAESTMRDAVNKI